MVISCVLLYTGFELWFEKRERVDTTNGRSGVPELGSRAAEGPVPHGGWRGQ